MLLDDIRLTLKSLEPSIKAFEHFWHNAHKEQEYAQLLAITDQEEFWKNPQQASLSKTFRRIKELRAEYLAVLNNYQELMELTELFSADEQELKKIAIDVHALVKRVDAFKIAILLGQEQDDSYCFLSINAGAGGTESQDWASMLLRMYTRFCEQERLQAHIIDYQAGEQAGIKSATLFVKGTHAFGLLKSEHGIHRLVRISPFDANKRRHTSFVGVHVMPEVPEVEIAIDPNDLRIDTFRAGGAGGQHVNKTESAIRITHAPSGIVVQCQNERSQHQNKEIAMKMLMAKLAQKRIEEQQAKVAAIEKKKMEWGSQIRSYVLHPYKMVKDHRTDHESPQPEIILDGSLMTFVEAYLLQAATTKKS